MPLSCGCDVDFEPGQRFAECCIEDFETLQTSKRKRCLSCKELINLGSFVVKFNISKVPEHEIEINIYGEDGLMPLADRYLCEKCGEIYLNLISLGFECVWPGEDMLELLAEYQRTYQPPKLIA